MTLPYAFVGRQCRLQHVIIRGIKTLMADLCDIGKHYSFRLRKAGNTGKRPFFIWNRQEKWGKNWFIIHGLSFDKVNLCSYRNNWRTKHVGNTELTRVND